MARKRRLNTKFLGISFAVVVIVGGGLFVAKKFFIHENPQPFITNGDNFFKSGDWSRAASNYMHAAALLPRDVRLAVQSGKSLMHMAADDPSKFSIAAAEWRHAVEVDPDDKEAWELLMDAYQAILTNLEGQTNNDRTHDILTQYFTLTRETANQLMRLDPKDARIRSYIPELNIRLWLLDISLPLTNAETTQPYDQRLTDDQKINAAVIDLTEMLRADPGDVQAGWWIARAKMHQAQLALQKDQTADAYALFEEASKVFDNSIAQNPPNLIDLYIEKVQLLSILVQTDKRPDFKAIYAKRLHEALDKTQQLVDPKNTQQYIAVKLTWAHEVALTDPGRAEQLFKEVIAKNPNDIDPKIQLALMLRADATRRVDALAILDQVPDAPPLDVSEMRRDKIKGQILQVKMLRADILTSQLASTQDSKEKDRISAQIQSLIDDLSTSSIEKWRVLKTQGKFQLQRGQFRDAIQTLNSANDLLNSSGGVKDSELLLLLAEAERRGEQTGNAIDMLTEAMKDPRVYNTPQPHLELATLFLMDRNVEKARPHISWLVMRYPDNPDIIRLQIRALDPILDKDEITKLYQKLPETNRNETLDKIQMARELNKVSEVERLLRALHTAKPDDIPITYQLGMVLLQSNQRDQAKQLADEALKLKPQDPSLLLLAQAATATSGKDLTDAVRHQIESIPDPFVRETKLADLSRMHGLSEEELTHLLAAVKIQPSNQVILERIFLWYIAAAQYDHAQEYVDRLAALDADQAHGQLYKFRLAMAKSDIQTALAIGRELTVDYKEFSESWESLGEALAASGQLESATAKFVEALNKQPTNVKALQNLIACSYRLGKLDDAKRYILDARHKFPDNPTYKKFEVEHELRYGDPETVLDAVRDDLTRTPDDPQTYQTASAALLRASSLKYAKGETELGKAHVAEARKILQKAITTWPDNLSLVMQFAHAAAQDGDIPAGEAALKSLLGHPRWKDDMHANLALADFYVNTNRPALAEAPLRDALAKTNSQAEIEMELAQVLIDQQKLEPALSVLDKHLDIILVRKMRTELLLRMNRGTQAESEVLEALKAAPNDRNLTKLLLFTYYGQGKDDQVRKLAGECIAADANNLAAHYYRALSNMHAAKPDLDAAINDLAFVRDQTSDNLEARMALCNAKEQKGDLNGAITEMEDALRVFPQNKQTRLKLIELYQTVDPPRWIDAQQVVTDGLGMPQFSNDVDMLRAAAVMYARHGDADKALTNIRAAMATLPDKSPLIRDYLTVLLLSKNYDFLLKETEPLIAAPNATWWIYDFRGQARAKNGDISGAAKEFDTAFTIVSGINSASMVNAAVHDATTAIGADKTLALVLPRTTNSAPWKLIALPLFDMTGDRAGGLKVAESAIASADTLNPTEQNQLYTMTAAFYLTSNPPQTDKAIALYQQLIQKHPDDYISMNNLACIYTEANPPRPREALKYASSAFNAVKATGHVQPLIYDTEGWALILDGQVDEGINVLHQAIDQSDFPDAHYHLAEGYLRKQLPEDAQRELDHATDYIAKATAAKRPVDTTLASKIDAARKRAQKMINDKTQAAAP